MRGKPPPADCLHGDAPTYVNRPMSYGAVVFHTAQMVRSRLLRRTALVGLTCVCIGAVPTLTTVAVAAGAAPSVKAGADQVITLADRAFLDGQVSDDGLPEASRLAVTWSVVSGPGPVAIASTAEAHTSATFGVTGSYVLRLRVDDGDATAADEVTVTVRQTAETVVRVPTDYATIQAALNAAPARALVLVAPGTYRENITVPRTLTLASTYYTTGDQSAVAGTVIAGASATTDSVLVSSAAGPETRIVGFTIRDGNDGIEVGGRAVVEHNVISSGTDGVDFPTGSAGLVHDNVLRGNGDDGVDINHSSVVITDNLMQAVGGDGVEARLTDVVAPLRDVVIRGNRIEQSHRDGLQIIDDDATTTTARSATLVTIDRNIITGAGRSGIGLLAGGNSSEDYSGASLVERITVTNNTFDGNNHGITGGDNLVAVNNVFAHHVGPALKNVDGASRVAYSQFFANGAANTASNVDAATSRTGDPMLDASSAPLPGSPVVDAGTASYTLPSGEVAVQVTGFSGTAPDIGAVESGGSAPTNRAPVVDAGPDATVTMPASVSLAGTASDDGLPAGSALAVTWSKVSGPGTVSFGDANAAATSASFSAAGDYVLRLGATDGELSTNDTTTVHVLAEGSTTVTTVRSAVAAGSDDAEESPSGSVDLTSSDLELVTDGSKVQTVGLRFPGVEVPKGAQVTAASIQFQTDEVSTDAASLTIQAQAADNPSTFTGTSRNVSSRARTTAAVTWVPPTWPTAGARGAAQRTTDLTQVTQEVVDRAGWAPGNAMVFVLTGSGRRTAEAFEGTGAPTLEVTYAVGGGGPAPNAAPLVDAGPDRSVTLPASASLSGTVTDDGLPSGGALTGLWSVASGPGPVSFANPTAPSTTASFTAAGQYVLRLTGSDGELSANDTVAVSVTAAGTGVTVVEARPAASSDDAEEKTSGSVSLTSTDLELVVDGSANQTVGIRFPSLSVPAGATVVRAWVQFTTDEATTGATNLTIGAQAADNPATFASTSRSVSSRARTTASVAWTPPAWPTKGQRGTDQQTPDLSPLLQQVLSRAGWASGNAVVIVISGTGTRTASAFDKAATSAPVLHVEYQS